MARFGGCLQPTAVARLPHTTSMLTASRSSCHARANTSAAAPCLPPRCSFHGPAAMLPTRASRSAAMVQQPLRFRCMSSVVPHGTQLTAALRQVLASPAANRALRQLRQQQAAHAAAVAVPEQQQAALADATSAAQPADAAALPQQYVVVNFYHLSDIPDAQEAYRQHKAVLGGLDIRGRIFITPQGINAQYSGPEADAVKYAQWVEQQPDFQGLRWTKAPVGEHMFNRLRLASRPHLVSLAGGTAHLPITDPAARAKPLRPAEWKEMLLKAQRIDPAARAGDAGATSSAAAAGVAAAVQSGSSGSGSSARDDGDGASSAWNSGSGSAGSRSKDNSTRSSKGNWRSLGGGVQPMPSSSEGGHTPQSRDQGAGQGGGGKDVVVLDVRNGYEWDAGHFQGAARPMEDQFRETPAGTNGAPLPAALHGAEPDTPVMMYCTGGIRCDIYSTYLRSQGFNNLYTLEGGVHNYLRQEGGDGWNGSLFVFDDRLAVPAVREGEETEGAPLLAAVGCQLCNSAQATLPHVNCANIDCGRLYVACEACKERMRGCCCEDCIQAPRLLRPAKTTGSYGRVSAYFDKEQLDKLREGRGEGRLIRRRRWQAKLRARREEHRQKRAANRAAAKAAMAAQTSSDDESATPGQLQSSTQTAEQQVAAVT